MLFRLKYGYRKYIRMVIYEAMGRNIAVEIREQLMFSSLKNEVTFSLVFKISGTKYPAATQMLLQMKAIARAK